MLQIESCRRRMLSQRTTFLGKDSVKSSDLQPSRIKAHVTLQLVRPFVLCLPTPGLLQSIFDRKN